MNTLFQEYKEKGFLVIKDFFNDDEISNFTSHIDPIYNNWRIENKSEITQEKLVNMHSLSDPKYFSKTPKSRIDFFNAICPRKLVNHLRMIFGEDIFFNNTQVFFNPDAEDKKPYWHRDLQYSPISVADQKNEMHNILALHVRIPLLAEKGLELIPGSHQRWDTDLENKVRYQQDGFSSDFNLADSKLIDLNIGDMIIFSAQILHKGVYDLSTERKALDICFGNMHPLISQYINPRVLPSNEEFKKIKNKQWYHYKGTS
ncbi:phytanoyl-CoA dioxygenase family protein [Lentisphaera profundi]|uniref:Phytanoyl-CoA dioxygenase family protein n=1 Tax=Lentisphaera profundi TaxID=1658616 RepID=A0ABY7VRP7_9BACT|nr:phytanoyl-CoA dioxygenase family protein [Lentisphaera profundi]WDE96875.1 phytanoyl-CoA dioxygenase family protein [Lentisphaera profundi]